MKFFKRTIVFTLSFSIIACTAMQPISAEPAQMQRDLHPGDLISVKSKKGSSVKFTLDRVDNTGLQGNGHNIPYDEVSSVSREETSWWRTGLLGAAIAAVAAIFSSGSNSGGGKSGGW